ncbi:MAG: class I SAM-dependent methyltransferase [Caulobacterales bacterium]|nr:class I SAM-dependent methyltransferase [Caulobacterales bacterium]
MTSLASPRPTLTVSGQKELVAQALTYPFESILDIGTGSGTAALAFHAAGKQVTATGFDLRAYRADPMPAGITLLEDVDVCQMTCFGDASFDAVWCAHVLEHTLNPGAALAEIRRVLRPGGHLFLSLPPYKHEVVGGHLTPGWNVGILMQVLVHAGFNVRDGSFVRRLNNIVAFVRRGEPPPDTLRRRNGDIEAMADLLPPSINAVQGFNGDLDAVNWRWRAPVRNSPRMIIRRWLAKRLRRLL